MKFYGDISDAHTNILAPQDMTTGYCVFIFLICDITGDVVHGNGVVWTGVDYSA